MSLIDDVRGALTDDWQTARAIAVRLHPGFMPYESPNRIYAMLMRLEKDGYCEHRTVKRTGRGSPTTKEWRLAQ